MRTRLRLSFLCGLLTFQLSAAAAADTLPAALEAFFSGLETLSAEFSQQVSDSSGEITQDARGRMWIARPGRFRWDYETPYRQQLVADGKSFWMYDEDLEQATMQPAADIITSTPAMLLSGIQPLDEIFHIESLVEGQSVRLQPKNDDSNITQVELQFSEDSIMQIVALDSFGNTTTFSFTGMRRNPDLDEGVFSFEPPPGTDVIGPGN